MNLNQIQEALAPRADEKKDDVVTAEGSEGKEQDHAAEAAAEERRPKFTRKYALDLLYREYLPEVLMGVVSAPTYASEDEAKTVDASDVQSLVSSMPLFQQKNELTVAYMELKEEEIVTLGKAIIENPFLAATVNHINFSGNQFTTKNFILFLHCVVAPILLFSGHLALENGFDSKLFYNIDAKTNSAKGENGEVEEGPKAQAIETLRNFVEKAVAFAKSYKETRVMSSRLFQTPSTATLPNAHYGSDAAIRNASSGCGTNFGVTGIECDNNGASTDGWKAFVALLSGDTEFLEEGEEVRRERLGGEFYTLKSCCERMLPDAFDNAEASMIHTVNCVSYHIICLSHIEIAENYIHDVGARYAASLLEMCPNIRYISFITNQITARGMKDISGAFSGRFAEMSESIEAREHQVRFLLSKKPSTATGNEGFRVNIDDLVQKTIFDEEKKDSFVTDDHAHEKQYAVDVLKNIASASKLTAAAANGPTATDNGALLLPYTITPAAFQANPFLVSPLLTEQGNAFAIQQLYLDYNSFGEAGVENAVEVLGNECPSLVKLGISDNRVGDKSAAAIATNIIANPLCRVQHLNLSVNTIGDAGFIAIAKALACCYVVKNEKKKEEEEGYTLYFKKNVRFDRPPQHLYDADNSLFVDELDGPSTPSSYYSDVLTNGVPVEIVAPEVDGEDGMGEGLDYQSKLAFTAEKVTLTQAQIDLLLVDSLEAGRKLAMNTRLYHLDIANQGKVVGTAGRTAILSLAFAYKYLMNLDVTALDVTNEEMRLFARSFSMGRSACFLKPSSSSSSSFESCPYWNYTCGLINAEWFNNPAIFPQTEQMVGEAIEAAIEKCQIREAFVNEYLKKEQQEGEEGEQQTVGGSVLNQIKLAFAQYTEDKITNLLSAVAENPHSRSTSAALTPSTSAANVPAPQATTSTTADAKWDTDDAKTSSRQGGSNVVLVGGVVAAAVAIAALVYAKASSQRK